ncbi:MAG TPA: APC family permease [Mycobacteriales bacterium]|nr:APC family permease [Mycobacteriales bacterium]
MSWLTDLTKRLVLGRPLRSDRLHDTLLPKRIALPVFASDALSSVAYAPEEILATLAVAGLSAYALSPWVGLAVAVVMLTVVASYRQTVHAYPSGGGDYEVATTNLGRTFGMVVAAALLVDYTLTVAVSVSSGVDNLASAVPSLEPHRVGIAVVLVVVLTALNLRGVRESGSAFAIPTYGFMVAVLGMIGYGLFRRYVLGSDLPAESAHFQIQTTHSFTGLAMAFLVLRAFSSGSAALTGVEAISNGVPAFRRPKSRNAATTLLMLGLIAVTMIIGIITLALVTHAKVIDEHDSTVRLAGAPDGYHQKTLIAQVGQAVFSNFTPGFYFLAATTALILVLAANTAFNGFPVLGSILARDKLLPHQLRTRGDKLAFSNGIVLLAGAAVVLILAFDADVNRLIHLYIVGVFVSFTCSQAGMIRHWNRQLRTEKDPSARRRMRRSQAINTFGLALTGAVLVVVLITKFLLGAWIAIVEMVLIFFVMRGIRRHYDRVAAELVPTDKLHLLPARNHAVVLVSQVHKPTLRALAYARATRPDTLTALTVNVDDVDTRELLAAWERRGLPVPLTVIESPYREITKPILSYVKRIRRESPRDLVTVFIPEYVVGRWWEQLLHNQTALRLKSRLLYMPGVMVTNVPWQLESSERAVDRGSRIQAGDVRRGVEPETRPSTPTKAGRPRDQRE